jgi:hypothetical protein
MSAMRRMSITSQVGLTGLSIQISSAPSAASRKAVFVKHVDVLEP